MNGFIPNTLNQAAVGQPPPPPQQQQLQPQHPQPAILMNGGIPNHIQPQQPPPSQQHHPNPHQQQQPAHNNHPQLVHYVQHQGAAPQLMIPNGNVIQLAPSLPPPSNSIQVQGPIYIQHQPQLQQHQPGLPQVRMMVNGGIPGGVGVHLQHQQQSSMSIGPRTRMIRLTPNGTYATTVQTPGGAGGVVGLIPGIVHPPGTTPTPTTTTATTLILTKPPPPKCLLCCLACFGLESLWFNPNFHFSRVIALICNILVDLLMILCLLSTNWLTTVKYRQGLWQYCIDVGSPRPLPFGLDDHDGCHWGRNAAYIKLSGFFAVACFTLALIATLLTSLGLSSRDPNKKYTFYRFALYINIGALLAIIVSLTLYPAFFYSELHHTNMVPSNRPHWYFGWAYGVGWGAAIFLVGAILLLVCDKETEEIYYQERTIVHANNHLINHHHSNHLNQQQQQHQTLANHLNHNNHQSLKA